MVLMNLSAGQEHVDAAGEGEGGTDSNTDVYTRPCVKHSLLKLLCSSVML